MEVAEAQPDEERCCVYSCSLAGITLHLCNCGNFFHHMCAGAAGNDDMNNCGRCRAPRPASPQRGGAGNYGAGNALNGDAPEGDGDGTGRARSGALGLTHVAFVLFAAAFKSESQARVLRTLLALLACASAQLTGALRGSQQLVWPLARV